MSLLIVLRGNSGSGKSTLALVLQRELGAVWIEQDYFRRTVLGETGNYSPLSVELVEASAALALRHGRTVIVEGMFNASKYSGCFNRLRDGHSGPSLFYAWDLSLEETLRRHATRPHKQAHFGEGAMRGWYHGWDPLQGIEEQRIVADESLEAAAARILADVRAV
ncbi:putative ABC-type ATPase [Arthrobacter stackebrandtii]|uniref:ABC-type ATPase n=1 Tax=Arthrobacter stackebrandtii TaxID=272161 RepID=A0ABS4YXV7_9MICC|nr:AAA family ATPase [Arthrobacter stackebrandtii]MBP2413569.1 putative ABC-type ATPase [Arthrobacter stackebrandtii]PYH00604.1 kinase [Arthrobacter stackebrandtii]